MKKISLNIDRIVKMYVSGQSSNNIAASIGVSKGVVVRGLKSAGIALDRNRSIRPFEKDIVSAYISGESELSISNRFGIARTGISRILRDANIKKRTGSEANIIRFQKASVKDRKKITKAANEAIRNKPKDFFIQSSIKQAIKKEQSQSKIGFLEDDFADYFSNNGYPIVKQKAVYLYNIDIAIRNIAVEIHGNTSNPHTHPKYRKRVIELLKRGWHVIYIKTTGNFSFQRTADKACRMIDLIQSNKSVGCQYGMVRGAGELISSGCLDGDNFSCVDASNGFFKAIK